MRSLYYNNIYNVIGFFIFVLCGNSLVADAPVQQYQQNNPTPVINVENGGGAVVVPENRNGVLNNDARRRDDAARHRNNQQHRGQEGKRGGSRR